MADTRIRLLRLIAEHDQLLARADAIMAERVDHSFKASAWKIRETVADLQSEVESHLEELGQRDN